MSIESAAIQTGLHHVQGIQPTTLADYYALWEKFGDIPVSEGTCSLEPDAIEEEFLHFGIGTHREDIWHWFEAQHSDFVVGEVMQGIYKLNADTL